MIQQTKIQRIKLIIKASIIIGVLVVFVVLGIFIRPNRTFENSRMSKWLLLSEQQRTTTVQRIIKDDSNQELLIKCIDKIASLPDSDEMLIRNAIVLCYNGIQMNIPSQDEK